MKKIFALFLLILALSVFAGAQSPMELAQEAKNMTPAAYYELSQEAERIYQQQNYAKAAQAYEKLTAAYPFDGEKWYLLGRARYQTGQFKEAAQAFVKAEEIGVPPHARFNVAYAARAFAQAGDANRALDWLERSVFVNRYEASLGLFQERVFDNLRQNLRFQKLVAPIVAKDVSRADGWRTDIDYLISQIKLRNAVYSKQPLPDKLVRAADKLKREIPKLSDEQMMVEMQHLLTLLGQTHNSLFTPGNLVKLTQLPLYFYVFPEGLYIVDAVAPYEDLIGVKVLRFDDTTAERAIEASKYLVGRENDMAILWTVPENLKVVQYLHALKITKNPDRVILTVVDKDGKTRTVSPEPVSLLARRKLQAPRLPNLSAPPLYLTRPDDQHWFEYLPKEKTLYLQFNQVSNKQNGESLAQLGLRLREFLAKTDVRNLVVDVRRNNGGNTYFYTELLRTLIDFDSNGNNRLFIITGRWTFSAAINFIADVDRLTNAVFVGEPSSSPPLTVGGDEGQITLPYSGVGGALSSSSWALTGPRETRLWIPPDIPVQTNAKDYFANRDPVMETILTMLPKDRK